MKLFYLEKSKEKSGENASFSCSNVSEGHCPVVSQEDFSKLSDAMHGQEIGKTQYFTLSLIYHW